MRSHIPTWRTALPVRDPAASGPGIRMHLFGFESNLERLDVLYTSLPPIQMWQGVAVTEVPNWTRSPRAWRRSWLLGFISAVVSRVREAEARAKADSQGTGPVGQPSRTDIALADRKQIIERNLAHAYPVTRKTQLAYSGPARERATAGDRRPTLASGGCARARPRPSPADSSRPRAPGPFPGQRTLARETATTPVGA